MIKTLGAQLGLFLTEPQLRANVGALLRYVGILAGIIVIFTILFHLLMVWEGQTHSWLSGFYWVLVTMSTLGYGDIAFHTDLGRAFSLVVLFTGVIMLLVVLPFVFIRYFYAPWLEAQIRIRAPREVAADVSGHVIICDWDSIAPGLVEQLTRHEIPYVVLDPDPEQAARRHGEGISILCGEVDSRETYLRARTQAARMVLANLDDVTNTNIVLTVREVAPEIPVVAIASSEDSADLLELAGATHVLGLRRQLGEQLANRINAGHAQTHAIGSFRNLVISEFPVLNTPLAGKTIRETGLREMLGINVVGVWEQALLKPAHPDRILTEQCLPVVIGTEEQMRELDEVLYIYDTNWNPVIVIGGGKVGRSAARSLKRKGVPVHLIERKPELAQRWADIPDRIFVGDAANRELLDEAGIQDAPAVLLTTNDDAMNVYLAVYCRRLNPKVRIVSRVTHDRNVDSIRRAGADLVLSYASLGVEAITSLARGRNMVLLGEGVELFEMELPKRLAGKTLAESGIGVRTGLNVVAVERDGALHPSPRAGEYLTSGCRLYMIGTPEQGQLFRREFGVE